MSVYALRHAFRKSVDGMLSSLTRWPMSVIEALTTLPRPADRCSCTVTTVWPKFVAA